MLAKSLIYKGSVYIYASRFRKHIRIPVGIKVDKLKNGLLPKSCGLSDIDGKNNQIKNALKQVQTALDTYPNFTAKQITTYIKKGTLPEEPAEIKQMTFLECFQKFVDDSHSGERLTGKGTRLTANTIKTYQTVLNNLKKFNQAYDLEWQNIDITFYNKFCEYYWYTLDSYDNNTGKAVKIVTTMLNWAYETGLINSAINTKKWKVWREEIEILVMYADEIKLLYDMPLTSDKLQRTRDIFLLGVFTCLRVENLLSLTEKDLLVLGNEYFINTVVQKTQKPVRIKLNPVAISIIEKYRNQYHTLLPTISSVKFNENLKELAGEFTNHLNELRTKKELDIVGNNWNENFKRVRTKKGVHYFEYIKPAKFISSHCMRRSGVTNLLMLGLSVQEVSSISQHSLNSRDFSKYVKIATQVIEKKSVDAWSNVLA
jgi:integrase